MNDFKLTAPPAEVGEQAVQAHRETTGTPPRRRFHDVIGVGIAKVFIGADGREIAGVDGEYDVVTGAQ